MMKPLTQQKLVKRWVAGHSTNTKEYYVIHIDDVRSAVQGLKKDLTAKPLQELVDKWFPVFKGESHEE
jgi:hypothetical protein